MWWLIPFGVMILLWGWVLYKRKNPPGSEEDFTNNALDSIAAIILTLIIWVIFLAVKLFVR